MSSLDQQRQLREEAEALLKQLSASQRLALVRALARVLLEEKREQQALADRRNLGGKR
jgi:hypothetical protein